MIRTLLQDLLYGFRIMLKHPGFTAVAVLTLALGIGANTAIFSVVNGVLLRPLPFSEPEQLVQIWERSPRQSADEMPASPPNFADWQARNKSFEYMAAYNWGSFALTGEGPPEQVQGVMVSPSFFQLLGVRPVPGRSFSAAEDQPGANRVAVISHGLWQRRFGASPALLGQNISINGEKYTVVGVAPPGFQFPPAQFTSTPDLWVPLDLELQTAKRGAHFLSVIGRLKPNVSIGQAQSELTGIARQIQQEYPTAEQGFEVNLVPLHEQLVGRIKPALLILLGAVCLVLLIACANMANLLLARAVSRRKEIALRAALGASRGRLIRQLLTESLQLSLIGGVLGIALSVLGVRLLLSLNPEGIPRVAEISLDGRVLLWTLLVSLATGVFFGLVPAFQASKTDLNNSLNDGSRGSVGGAGGRKGLQVWLVVSEVALALVLLIGSGLLIKSLLRLQQVSPGFNAQNTLTMRISLPAAKYAEPFAQAAFFQRVIERVQAQPGVAAVGAVTDLPFSHSLTRTSFTIMGRPPVPNEPLVADFESCTPEYFKAMGIPLIKGRDFTEADVRTAPGVVIINETLARRYWSGADPLGQHLVVGGPREQAIYGGGVVREVVGVVADVKSESLAAKFAPQMYVPFAQLPSPGMFLAVRGHADPRALIAQVSGAVSEIDKEQPLDSIKTMEQNLDSSVAPQRFNMMLFSVFAAVALILGATGIYGVVYYAVSRRTQEIGIRMALGAKPGDVLRLVIWQMMAPVLIGVVVGLALAVTLTRFLTTLLYGVGGIDSTVFVSFSLILIVIALLSSYLPARKAARVSPLVALRHD